MQVQLLPGALSTWPVRLSAKDIGPSRRKGGFDSRTGHLSSMTMWWNWQTRDGQNVVPIAALGVRLSPWSLLVPWSVVRHFPAVSTGKPGLLNVPSPHCLPGNQDIAGAAGAELAPIRPVRPVRYRGLQLEEHAAGGRRLNRAS